MKCLPVRYVLIALTLTAPALPQTGDVMPRPMGIDIPVPQPSVPDPPRSGFFISGRVVLEDGAPVPQPAAIQSICAGQRRTEAYTDKSGNFDFRFATVRSANSGAGGVSDAEVAFGDPERGTNQIDWRNCELKAVLSGFSSEAIHLGANISSLDTRNVGQLVLHRMGKVQGLTMSATSAQASKPARKALEKGREMAQKEKWDEAEEWLRKAVEIYPKYAVAWYELGRAQRNKGNLAGARDSFNQALAADRNYVSPYQALSELDIHDQRWQELVTVTGQVMALDAVDFPDAWFRNAVGNFYLQNYDAAENSARQGAAVDEHHQVPKLQYLLGLILVQKHQYEEALEQMRQFRREVTKQADIQEAERQLGEIEKLSASANADSPK